jgi:hypothetical protein
MGALSGSNAVQAGTETFNLSSPARTDWIEFPLSWTAPNRKSGGGSTFGLPTTVGTGTLTKDTFSGIGYTITWSDGTPAASGSVTQGIIVSPTTPAAGQGITFTAPADTNTRTLDIWWGTYSAPGRIVAHLSDGSATDLTINTTGNSGNPAYQKTTITYSANSAGQTLTLTMTITGLLASSGQAWLEAAAYTTSASGATGSAASTQAANTSSASGSVSFSGSAASTQAANTSSGTGGVRVSGAAASSQAANSGAASGSVLASGSAASAQAGNAASASGGVSVSGAASSAQAANTSSASGSVTLSGAGSGVQAPNTSAGSGAVALTGAGSATQAPNTGAGTVSNGSAESINGTAIPNNATQIIDAALAVWTLTGDGHAAKNGVNQSTGSASPYTLLLYWNHVVYGYTGTEWRKNTATPWTVTTDPRPAAAVGSGSSTQASGVSNAIGGVSVGGSAASAQAPNAAAATGSAAVSGSGASTQAPNVGNASGAVISVITGSASATQAPNTSAALGAVSISGAAASVQRPNTSTASAVVIDTSTPDPIRFTVSAERRTCVVARDPRRLPVAREARAARVTHESRRVIVPAEVRRITV